MMPQKSDLNELGRLKSAFLTLDIVHSLVLRHCRFRLEILLAE
jgi:hypothetical protein